MSEIRTSAPGKIVLCGEYAVLAGATAIAVAIDRRARVTLRQGVADSRHVRIRSDIDRVVPFQLDGAGNLTWPEGNNVALLDSVCRTVVAMPEATASVTLDTRQFFDADNGLKYGFGSSAALVSALTLALVTPGGKVATLGQQSLAAHRDWQGGAGSGVDIATSTNGGLLEFRTGKKPVCRPLHWPVGLRWSVLWSGQPASTRQQLGKLGGMADSGGRHDTATQNLLAEAEVLAAAWKTGTAGQVLQRLREYTKALMEFSDDRQLGIFDAGHDRLHRMAGDSGILYKPCGAGGGDIGAAFATDASALEEFTRAAGDAGFQVVPVSPEPRGVSTDSGNGSG